MRPPRPQSRILAVQPALWCPLAFIVAASLCAGCTGGGDAATTTGRLDAGSGGGMEATGGGASGTVGSGGSLGSGGVATGMAGTVGTAGTSGTGGSTGTGGTPASGGASGGAGSNGKGGTMGSGGQLGTGGSGGSPNGGSPGTGAGGSTGGGGSNPAGNVPSGYPTPTSANVATCKTVPTQPVPMTGSLCPGGGDGPVCIECLFGGSTYTIANVATSQGISEAGNYLVTVELGGAAAGDTFMSAEANRGLLSSVTTAAGQTATYAFVVNVRANEGQPVESTASAGYPGLDLFFSGTAPQVTGIGYALASASTTPTMLYIASDSTACDQTDQAYAGWGQMLPEFLGPPLGVANYADSGESSASFYGNPQMWGAIKAHWKKGDWVMVQFGHNDKSSTDAQVQANLEKYVTDAQAAGVTAVLISPPARVGDWNGSTLGDQSGLHGAAAAAAAAAKGVAFIDLTALSTAWYNQLGSKAAALKYHADGTDATHTNMAGATKLASLVAGAIKTQNLGLATYLRP
jgi:lysophospholipase L1-like esterase